MTTMSSDDKQNGPSTSDERFLEAGALAGFSSIEKLLEVGGHPWVITLDSNYLMPVPSDQRCKMIGQTSAGVCAARQAR